MAEKVEGLRLGAVDYITKPFHREELLVRVRTHLELARLRANLEQQVEQRTNQLRESEERFRTMADAAPVMIWASDVNRRRTFFNKKWLEFTGRSADQELGDGWLDDLHPDDRIDYVTKYSAAFDARVLYRSNTACAGRMASTARCLKTAFLEWLHMRDLPAM